MNTIEELQLLDVGFQSKALLDGRLTRGEVAPRMSNVSLQQEEMLNKVGERVLRSTAHRVVHRLREEIVGILQLANDVFKILSEN